jgi:cell wall-associated NlpC family hydrolase
VKTVFLAAVGALCVIVTGALAEKSADANADSAGTEQKAGAATPRPRKKSTGSGGASATTPRPASKKKPPNETKSDDATAAETSSKPKAGTVPKKKSSSANATKEEEATESGKADSAKPTKSSGTKNGASESTDVASPAKTTAAVDPAAPPPGKVASAENATIAPKELIEFDAQPPRVRKLIEAALELTRQNLTYTYGSADPSNGGMDCSGFVYYVLRQQGFTDVPRAANEQYVWVRKADNFDAVLSKKKQSFELDALQPGDLLFWTGTYTTDRDPPVTHAMIYLGTERETKQRVMVGSSDGRTYRGKARWGVSVFDFQGGQTSKDPAKAGRGGFVGYATIPGLRSS